MWGGKVKTYSALLLSGGNYQLLYAHISGVSCFACRTMSPALFSATRLVGAYIQDGWMDGWTNRRTWVLSRIQTSVSERALCLTLPIGYSVWLPAASTGYFDCHSETSNLAHQVPAAFTLSVKLWTQSRSENSFCALISCNL